MLAILTCGAAYALPVGNPADPIMLQDGIFFETNCEDCNPCFNWDLFSLKVGYYGDFVFDRDLKVDHDGDAFIDHSEFYTNAGLISLNVWDRIDVYAMLGSTKGYINSNSDAFAVAGGRIEIETETDFSWGVGVKGTIWEYGCTAIGLDAKYFRAHPDVRRITLNNVTTVNPDDSIDMLYREWQVGVGIAHRINMFVPYFAVKWSKADVDFHGVDIAGVFARRDLENRQSFGYAFGVSLVDCDMMSLNVEARLRDEKAVAVNAQVRF